MAIFRRFIHSTADAFAEKDRMGGRLESECQTSRIIQMLLYTFVGCSVQRVPEASNATWQQCSEADLLSRSREIVCNPPMRHTKCLFNWSKNAEKGLAHSPLDMRIRCSPVDSQQRGMEVMILRVIVNPINSQPADHTLGSAGRRLEGTGLVICDDYSVRMVRYVGLRRVALTAIRLVVLISGCIEFRHRLAFQVLVCLERVAGKFFPFVQVNGDGLKIV